jgi:hypothetical protein
VGPVAATAAGWFEERDVAEQATDSSGVVMNLFGDLDENVFPMLASDGADEAQGVLGPQKEVGADGEVFGQLAASGTGDLFQRLLARDTAAFPDEPGCFTFQFAQESRSNFGALFPLMTADATARD